MTASETAYASVASSSAATTMALTGYYGSVLVENLTATSGTIIWVRADGTAAVKEADDCFAIDPGQSLVLDNGLANWSQAYSVIPAGTLVGGGPSQGPAVVQPFGSSLAGGTANPGTSVSVILDTGSGPVQVAVSSVD
jgi:hypothetical protein